MNRSIENESRPGHEIIRSGTRNVLKYGLIGLGALYVVETLHDSQLELMPKVGVGLLAVGGVRRAVELLFDQSPSE